MAEADTLEYFEQAVSRQDASLASEEWETRLGALTALKVRIEGPDGAASLAAPTDSPSSVLPQLRSIISPALLAQNPLLAVK